MKDKQDKRVILAYLDCRIAAGMPSSRGEDWQPLLMYRNSLVHGEGDQPPQTSKQAYTRKRKHVDDDDDDDDDDAPFHGDKSENEIWLKRGSKRKRSMGQGRGR